MLTSPASNDAISRLAPSIGTSNPSKRPVIDGCNSTPGGNVSPAIIAAL